MVSNDSKSLIFAQLGEWKDDRAFHIRCHPLRWSTSAIHSVLFVMDTNLARRLEEQMMMGSCK